MSGGTAASHGAFQCDLSVAPEEPQGSPPSWWSSDQLPALSEHERGHGHGDASLAGFDLAMLFASLVERYRATYGPFAIGLEGPSYSTVPYDSHYHHRIDDAIRALKHAYMEMLRELVGHLWGLPAGAHVSSAELAWHGHDVTAFPPDSGEYF